MTITDIASICHETNRAYCQTIGDFSQPEWKYAPDWQQKSALQGVQFKLDNPLAADCHQHESWMRDKLAAGWTHGPVKDANAKKHPCLVPYDQLPAEQRAKDALFGAIVTSLKPYLEPQAT